MILHQFRYNAKKLYNVINRVCMTIDSLVIPFETIEDFTDLVKM